MRNCALAGCVLAAVLAWSGVAHGDILVQSTFDNDAEGWKCTGDTHGLGAGGGAIRAATWEATGGSPDGRLSNVDDGLGGTWYWMAPSQFLGDKHASIGGSLVFDIQASHQGNWNTTDLLLQGAGIQLTGDMSTNPGTGWTHYDIALVEADWYNKTAGRAVTADEFTQVLSNLDQMWIRGEYYDGHDTGHLDNVALTSGFGVPEPASMTLLVLGGLAFLVRRRS